MKFSVAGAIRPRFPAPLTSTPMQELPLESIAEVQAGFPFRGKIESAPESDYRVIQGKDIRPGFTFDAQKLTRFNVPPRARPEGKLLQQDDIIFMTRSEKPYAVHIPFELPLTVVQNSFVSIRTTSTDTVLPGFLAMMLNQSAMRARIAELIKGSNIPYIRIEDLRKLLIPIPAFERQQHLAALESSLRHEQNLHRALETARQDQLDALILSDLSH